MIVDPFSDLARFAESYRGVLKNERDDLIKSLNKIGWVLGGVVLAAISLGWVVWGDGAAFLITLLGFGVLLAVTVPKAKKMMGCIAGLKKYFPD